MIKKYDIVKVNLNPKKGHTQAWIRPAIVIQSDLFNKYSPTIIIVPLTTNLKEPFPSEFIIKKSKTNWLESDSRVLGNQLITVDKRYVLAKYGVLDEEYRIYLNEALKLVLWL